MFPTKILILFLYFFVLIISALEFKKDQYGFAVINGTDLQEIIDTYKHVLVFIYVPDQIEAVDCLEALKNVSRDIGPIPKHVILVKIPISFDDKLVSKYDIMNGVGLFSIHDHGERNIEYTGYKSKANDILLFFRQKMQPLVTQINNYDILKKLVENHKCSTLGLFENVTFSNEFEEYKAAADWFYECNHYYTTNKTIIDLIHPGEPLPTVKFYKGCIHDFWELPTETKMTANIEILKFFVTAHQPDLGIFGMEWLMKRNLREPLFTLLLFCLSSDTNTMKYKNILEKYARRYRNEINVAYVEVDKDEDASSLLISLGVSDWSNLPVIRAIEQANQYGNNTRKLKPSGSSFTVSDASVSKFIGEVYYKQIKPFLLSDPVPDQNPSDPIRIVVGDNFKNITQDPSTRTLVAFYRSEPKFERLMSGPYLQLVEHYKSLGQLNSNIILGVANTSTNEFYGWHPDRFPSLILFPEGVGTWGIEFKKDYEYANLVKFIDSNGQIQEDAPKKEKQKEDNDDESEVTDEQSEISSTQKTEL